jgi:hypothetical protein
MVECVGMSGEYDPWDEMSAMNIWAFNTANFGTSAVGARRASFKINAIVKTAWRRC